MKISGCGPMYKEQLHCISIVGLGKLITNTLRLIYMAFTQVLYIFGVCTIPTYIESLLISSLKDHDL